MHTLFNCSANEIINKGVKLDISFWRDYASLKYKIIYLPYSFPDWKTYSLWREKGEKLIYSDNSLVLSNKCVQSYVYDDNTMVYLESDGNVYIHRNDGIEEIITLLPLESYIIKISVSTNKMGELACLSKDSILYIFDIVSLCVRDMLWSHKNFLDIHYGEETRIITNAEGIYSIIGNCINIEQIKKKNYQIKKWRQYIDLAPVILTYSNELIQGSQCVSGIIDFEMNDNGNIACLTKDYMLILIDNLLDKNRKIETIDNAVKNIYVISDSLLMYLNSNNKTKKINISQIYPVKH